MSEPPAVPPTTRPLAGLVVLSVGPGETASLMLKASGAVVMGRRSAVEVLQVLETFVPNAIVVEVTADDQEGLAALREIRRFTPEGGGDVPVVVIADDATPAAGFRTTLVGGFDVAQLVRAVLHAVERR